MNKSDLIAKLAEDLSVPKVQAARFLNAAIDSIVDTVAQGETVGIAGVGTFSSRARAGRQGRNPQTGEAMDIAARTAPHFKPGTEFKRSVNA